MSREMIDSNAGWIGSIPSEWSAYKLLYALERPIFDGPHETPTVVDNGIPFISVDSVNDTKNVDLNVCKKFISEEDFNEYYKKTPLKQGDVLFTKAATIGKTAIVDDRKYMVWSPLAILRSGKHVNNEYLYYVLNCPNLIDYTAHFLGNSATQINVGMRELERAKLPVPPLSEQRQIVHFLDRKCAAIDTAIEKTKESIEKLEEYKKAVITKAVTKGLDPDAKMKDSGVEGLGGIPETWDTCPMKTLFSFGKGLSITKDDLVEEGKPVLSYGQIHSKTNPKVSTPAELLRYVPEAKAKPQSLTSIGDFVFADTSEDRDGCGNCNYIDVEGIYAGYHTIIARAKSTTDNKYFGYLFDTDAWRFQMRRELTEVKLYSVSQKVLKNTVVLVPTEKDNKQIVSYLDSKCGSIDALIAKKKETINKWEEYKKSLIYYAVTGKIDCRNEVIDVES